MDWEGNFYKVTAKIGSVDFIIIDKDMIILSNGSGLLNTVGDLAKRIPIFGGDNPIFSGTKLVGSPDANELTEKWYPTKKKEVGEPAKMISMDSFPKNQTCFEKTINDRINRLLENWEGLSTENIMNEIDFF